MKSRKKSDRWVKEEQEWEEGGPSPINQAITQTSELSKKILEASKIETGITNPTHSAAPAQLINNSNDKVTHRGPMIKGIPFYPSPTYRPPPKPVRIPALEISESTNINSNFWGKFSFSRRNNFGVYQRPGKSFFQDIKNNKERYLRICTCLSQ